MDRDLVPLRSSSRPANSTSAPASSQNSVHSGIGTNNQRFQPLPFTDSRGQRLTRWNSDSLDFGPEIETPAYSNVIPQPRAFVQASLNTQFDPPIQRHYSGPHPAAAESQRIESSNQLYSTTRKRVASSAAQNQHDYKRTQSGVRTVATAPATQGPTYLPGASANHPIDLTNPPSGFIPPFPTHMSQSYRYNPYPTSPNRPPIELPPWQPDADVTHCPVCGAAFGFLYRKHHCRKCGRVVCDNCSRHRIGLPRQYIVQAPPGGTSSPFGTFSALGMPAALQGGSPNPGYYSSMYDPINALRRSNVENIGGAEVVRVCNPCVPDPNFSPPPQTPVSGTSGQAYPPSLAVSGTGSGQSNSAERSRATTSLPIRHSNSNIAAHNSQPPVAVPERRGSGREGFGVSNTHYNFTPASASAYPSARGYNVPNTGLNPHTEDARRAAYSSSRPLPSNRAPLNDDLNTAPTTPSWERPPIPRGVRRATLNTPTSDLRARHLPHTTADPSGSSTVGPSRGEVPEEDECPVCGNELPPAGANNNTKAREKHIEQCIQRHSFSAPSATTAPSSAPGLRYPPHAYPSHQHTFSNPPVSSDAGVGRDPVNSSTTRRASHDPAVDPRAPAPAQMTLPQRPRGNRMIAFKASEKDCTGEDGEPQECIICFEEFEPGAEMGRLECWCKFHRACIEKWWETKGPGSCPTHQLHG